SLDKRILQKAIQQSINSKVVMMIGTRGEVDPAAKLPLMAKNENKAKIIEVNIGPTRLSKHADIVLRGSAGAVLPKLQ
ncbi:cobB2, partial [Symbiodinium microadriaticum]